MKTILAIIFIVCCRAVDESLNLNELKAAFNLGSFWDELDDNVTLKILKEDSLQLNVTTQELIDNCRDAIKIVVMRRFEYLNGTDLMYLLGNFNVRINNTQELLEYFQDVAPQFYQSILWRKELIESLMRRYLGKEATEFVEWAAREFSEMSYNNIADWNENGIRRERHGNKVLAKLETLSEEGQRQIKAAFPFWTLKKLQPLDHIYINYYLGALLEAESPENHATPQF